LPNPPATLELYIWVQHDHDADEDGFATADEYISITLTSDGGVPNSNYSGEYNDYANEGQDPVGKVSLWIEGFDLAGNPIDGGAPGFDNDQVTYVSMSSKNPVLETSSSMIQVIAALSILTNNNGKVIGTKQCMLEMNIT
jgi:hypothetical protein